MPKVRKVNTIPPALRAWLQRTFVERAFGDIEGITAELNAALKQAGLDITIGKSAVGEESQRVRRAQEAIRATTEAARLIADAAPDEGDNRSAAAMAIVQSEVFELLLKVRESDEITNPVERLGVMNEAALGLSRLSRSRVNQARWNAEVEARAKAAADAVAKIVKTGGLTQAQQDEIRARILGVATAAAAPAGAG